jgi:pimeloyl-ACP methyl ester carboxylesterase
MIRVLSAFILAIALAGGCLPHSAKVRVVVTPGATHFVHLDRPNHGRDLLIKEVVSFVPSQTNP